MNYGGGAQTVLCSRINTESALRSAADVKVLLTSPIFLCGAIKATVPQCSAPHPIAVECGKHRLPGPTSPRTPAFMRVNRGVSTAKETWITQLPHTDLQNNVICLHTDSTGQENILTVDCTVTLMINVYFDCPF